MLIGYLIQLSRHFFQKKKNCNRGQVKNFLRLTRGGETALVEINFDPFSLMPETEIN